MCTENVTRWERTVQDGEDELEAGRQAEAKQRQDIDRELRRADAAKAERAAARARLQTQEDSLEKVSSYLCNCRHEGALKKMRSLGCGCGRRMIRARRRGFMAATADAR
jgi:hypothetical protein